MAFVPLAPLVPAWDDHYIPEVYGFIEKGIRKLQARYCMDRYIVISYVVSGNEDRYTDTFNFEFGVNTPEGAVRACGGVLRYLMLERLVKAGPYSDNYRVQKDHWMEESTLQKFPPKIDMMAWETQGNGWESVSVFVGVLEKAGRYLSGEELGAMGRKHDLIPYLRMLGGDPSMNWMVRR